MVIETQARLEEKLRKSVRSLKMIRETAETVREVSAQLESEPQPRTVEIARPPALGVGQGPR